MNAEMKQIDDALYTKISSLKEEITLKGGYMRTRHEAPRCKIHEEGTTIATTTTMFLSAAANTVKSSMTAFETPQMGATSKTTCEPKSRIKEETKCYRGEIIAQTGVE